MRANAHKLSNIDSESHTANCVVCGRVKVYPRNEKKTGYKGWRCSNQGKAKAKRASKKEYSKDKKKVLNRNRKSRLWRLYRITEEEQKLIEKFQREHPTMYRLLGNKMGTDHDHKTGLIRGRLDWRINRAYGLLEKVDPEHVSELLRALADYHDNPPATSALGEKRYGLMGKAQYKKKMVYGPPSGAGLSLGSERLNVQDSKSESKPLCFEVERTE